MHLITQVSDTMGWLRLVGSLKLQVSFAKEPYKRDDILQKRPIILRSLLIVATPQNESLIPSESLLLALLVITTGTFMGVMTTETRMAAAILLEKDVARVCA